MQSFLIISNDQTKTQEHLATFYKNHDVGTFAITTLTLGLTTTGKPAESIGIAEIRNLHKTLYLKSIKGAKAIVIQNAETLTDEAQNSLLKVLEEPPPATYFFLVVHKQDSVLPTILSRCFVVDLTSPMTNEKPKVESLATWEVVQSASIAEKMHLVQTIGKTKTEVLPWLTKSILSQRSQLLEMIKQGGNAKHYAISLHALSLAHKTISTSNANITLVLEHMLLGL